MSNFLKGLVLLVAVGSSSGAPSTIQKSWTQELSSCGSDANDDYPSKGNVCLTKFTETVDADPALFKPCDQQYCECASTGGDSAWNATTATCHLLPEHCGVGCECLAQCYKPFMNCTWSTLTTTLDTIQECHDSKMYSCILDTHDAFVAECKNGVREGRITWSDAPVPKQCMDDNLEDQICAGSMSVPYSMTVVASLLVMLIIG